MTFQRHRKNTYTGLEGQQGQACPARLSPCYPKRIMKTSGMCFQTGHWSYRKLNRPSLRKLHSFLLEGSMRTGAADIEALKGAMEEGVLTEALRIQEATRQEGVLEARIKAKAQERVAVPEATAQEAAGTIVVEDLDDYFLISLD